jgi:hypothetical protein
MRRLFLTCLLIAAPAWAATAGTARAQEKPPLLPTRDVSVDYRATAGGRTTNIRVLYSAGTERLRAEASGQSTYLIIDGRARTAHVVMDRQHSVLDLPFDTDRWRGFILSDRATFTRIGSDRILGHACTDWKVSGPSGDGTACVTDDGVILRGAASGEAPDGHAGTGSITAVAVHYGLQPDDVFAVPAGYKTMAMPQLPSMRSQR